MNIIEKDIELTKETFEDHPSNTLPTLDYKIWSEEVRFPARGSPRGNPHTISTQPSTPNPTQPQPNQQESCDLEGRNEGHNMSSQVAH